MLILAMALALIAHQDVQGPKWAKLPTPTADDFPARALEQGVSGSATVRCVVTATGHLTNCVLTGENPAGMGFGRAAIRVAQRARIDVTEHSSETVTTTIAFNLR